jgi:hypothetical protein
MRNYFMFSSYSAGMQITCTEAQNVSVTEPEEGVDVTVERTEPAINMGDKNKMFKITMSLQDPDVWPPRTNSWLISSETLHKLNQKISQVTFEESLESTDNYKGQDG